MQHESRTTLPAHLQRSQVVSFPRRYPRPSMQIINQRADPLREQPQLIHLVPESIYPASETAKSIQFPQIQCEVRLQLIKHTNNQSTSINIYNCIMKHTTKITIGSTLASSSQDCSMPRAGLLVWRPTRFSFRFIIRPRASRLDACLGSTSASLHLWHRFIRRRN